jgi:sugar phosphate isomerase/epimerase
LDHRTGAQTITWGERNKDSMPAILQFLVENGYSGVETGMRHFDATRPTEYRTLYEESGIIPLGLHSGGQFWDPDAAQAERRKLWDAVDFARAVGFQWLIVSGNKAETVDSMREAAGMYSKIGSRCREAGLRFAYHNHNWELANDAEILDVLVQSTESADVSLVLDVAWAHVGGHSVAGLLGRYGDRIAYLHVKDVEGERFCELGTGDMDLELVLDLADSHGIEWLVIEQDYTSLTPEGSMSINRKFLAERGW